MMMPLGVLLSEARVPKDPATMTASQINKELDALGKASSKITDEMIAAGRGRERPSETREMTDPLSLKALTIWDRQMTLHSEIERRYGPRAPSRLPIKRGWYGPRKESIEETGYDVTAGPKERARRAKAEKERLAHHAAQKAQHGDDPNAPARAARERIAAKRVAKKAAKKAAKKGESIAEADVDIRRLERLAAAGDEQAAVALDRARERAGLTAVLATVYGHTQSGKPMRAVPVYGTGQRMRSITPELRAATSGWSPQDLADANILAYLYAKKRGKDKRFSKTGFASDARFSPEGLGFSNQAKALHDLLREHPDVVAAAVDRPGIGSGLGWAAVRYTDIAARFYKSFFRGAAGKKLYAQRYFERA